MVAANLAAGVASGAFAFLSAVRSAERCARLRTVAARDLRMFFLADAMFGTKKISGIAVECCVLRRLEPRF